MPVTDARQFSVVPIRALLNRNLTAGDRCVLEALGAHTNAEGICWPSVETLQDYAGGISDRSVRRSLRVLEDEGLIKTWKVGVKNYYQVLYDVAPEVALRSAIAEENRTPLSGVASDKQHRTPVSGSEVPDEGGHTGQGSPVEGTPASGLTGRGGPGERVQERRTALTAADAREEDSMAAVGTDDTKVDTTGDTGRKTVQQLAIDLGIAVNGALRDNPAMRAHAELYPLRADLAVTPLKDWFADGIPFEVIRAACVKAAARFKPAQKGDHIARFTYFDRIIRAEWGTVQANAQVEAAATPRSAEVKKIRRLSA